MLVIALTLSCATAPLGAQAAASERVNFYPFPASIINDTNTLFYIARGAYMNGLGLHGGAPIQTASRLENPTGIEIKPAFQASDLMVVTPGLTTNTLWLAVLNPTDTNYAGQLGQRLYCGGIFVGNDVQIMLDGFSSSVIDAKGYLDNQSTLKGLGYSVSRYGIIKGPSGDLFGNDHTIIQSGSGSIPVDAIVFIGARVGADVSQYGQAGINAVESYIGSGDTFTFVYTYMWTSGGQVFSENHSWTVPVYQDGQVPTNYWGMSYWKTPRAPAMLLSLMEPPDNTYTVSVALSSLADGLPHKGGSVSWMLNNASAATGWSYEDPSWPAHDAVFVDYQQNAGVVTPSPGAESHAKANILVKVAPGSPTSPTSFFQPSN